MRSGPSMTFSMLSVSSSMVMRFLLRRAVRMAASFMRFAKSAPENPGVRSAMRAEPGRGLRTASVADGRLVVTGRRVDSGRVGV